MEPDAAPRADDEPDIVADDGAGDHDPWAWVHQAAEPDEQELTGHHVTAVLVAHDGAEWLPDALQGVAELHHQPDRVLLVDAGSSDDTATLLAAAADDHPTWSCVTAEAGHYGRAVATALDAPDTDTDTGEPAEEWLWLLHDDAVATPGSLGTLLAAAVRAGVAIATPGLSHPATRQEPARVSELGESVARSGRREVHVDPGEIDQGQHHTVREVLGGSTCGLLVRRDVYDRLGGLSPELTGHRDGVELGWRATLAGETAVAVPDARLHHRQVGLGGLRSGSEHAAAVDRAYGMALASAHATGVRRVLTPVALVVGAVLRAIGFLLGKSPDRAGDELAGLRRHLAGGGRTGRLRAAAQAVDPAPAARDRADGLRPGPFAGLRLVRDAVGAGWADRGDASEAETDLDELTGDEFAGRDRRPAWRSAYAIAWAVTVVAAVVAARTVFGEGSLVGPALLPATDSLAAAYGQWLAPVPATGWWQAPPWLGFHALLATLLLGQPGWASALVVLGAVPLTMAAALPLLRRLVTDRRVRVWAGLMLGLLPVLLGASTQGRLGLIAVAVLAPLFVAAVLAMVDRLADGDDGADVTGGTGWRHAWAAGLVLTPLVAHQPVFAALALLALAVLVVVRRHAGVGRLLARAAVALAVPAVVLAPWWPVLVTRPGRWLLGPDAALDGTTAAPSAWALLLGRPAGDGLPPWWVSAACLGLVWLLALLALVLRPSTVRLRAAWGAATAVLLVAVVMTRVVVPAGAGLEPTRPTAAAVLLVGLGALVVAGAIGIDTVPALLAGRDFSWLQPLTVLAAVVVVLTTVLGAGWWVASGGAGPLQRDTDQLVPGFVADGLQRQPGSRVLVVDASGDPVGYLVVGASGVRLGDADRGYSFGGATDTAATAESATRRLVAATGDETVTEDLRELGVRYIAVRGPDALVTRINSGAGLRVVSVRPDSRVWEITGAADSPPPTAPPRVTTSGVLVAIGQGVALLLVAFCAAPRLRPARSRDPAQRARLVAAREGE